MSPQSVAPTQPPEEIYEQLHIDDFTPGVYDGSHISTEQPVISAPLGAANAVGTFACAAIPGGALAPLPGIGATTTYTPSFPGSVTQLLLAGFIVTPQLNNGDYEIVTIFEGDDGTNHYVIALSYVPATASANTISGPTETAGSTGGFFGAPYPAFTRMTSSGSGNPPPVLVFPTAVSTDSSGTNGHLWVYPELLSPTSFVAQDLIVAASSVTGQVICYANRVTVLAGVDYSWPTGSGINTNENVNFTDPPQSSTYGNQKELLGAEVPWGYGAWGSVSVGELLLVKKYGGAVIVNGDIDAPSSVIPVPGVESTGDFVGSAAATPAGLVYCSQNRGAWLWNGGNTSTKISKQLHDSFFDLETGALASNNYGFFCYHWQKWVMFSNNYIYDTENGTWWVIYPQQGVNAGNLTGRNIFWWCLTNNGNQILGAPLLMPNGNRTWFSTFDNTVPSSTYQWTSLPIHVTKDADRVLDVRQVTIRASDPSGSTTGSVSVSVNGTSIGSSLGITIGVDPTTIRLNAGVRGLEDIIITVLANNSDTVDPAPIIHSIDVGYQIRQKVAVNN